MEANSRAGYQATSKEDYLCAHANLVAAQTATVSKMECKDCKRCKCSSGYTIQRSLLEIVFAVTVLTVAIVFFNY